MYPEILIHWVLAHRVGVYEITWKEKDMLHMPDYARDRSKVWKETYSVPRLDKFEVEHWDILHTWKVSGLGSR